MKLPAIFGTHMVLQRDQKDRVWGWAEPGEEVTVEIAGQSKSAKAGPDGSWQVALDSMPAGGPHTMTVKGKNTVRFDDVLVGEVWICSGQSNMQWGVGSSKDVELEIPAAKYPNIRLIAVPNVGTQELQKDFKGQWVACRPETVGGFSAVGYFFGRQLHQTLGVPVGLINDAWGGSACEAWIRRDVLAADPKYGPMLQNWEAFEKNYPKAKEEYQASYKAWEEAAKKAKAENKPEPQQPFNPDWMMYGNARPGNIYNGALKPTIGYGIRGVIWYQGETNAGRAYQYRDLFPLMIKSWRDEWGQGDFSFYWVQLADFMGESREPRDSAWAELREAQTMTMDRLPHTGQAVIIDIGEGKDIHPRNKQDVANRLRAGLWLTTMACRSRTAARLTSRWHDRVTRSSSRSTTSAAGSTRSTRMKRGDSPSPAPIASSSPPRREFRGRARSRCGPTEYPSRCPCATPGPTTRSATFTAPRACRPRRSAPTTGRG